MKKREEEKGPKAPPFSCILKLFDLQANIYFQFFLFSFLHDTWENDLRARLLFRHETGKREKREVRQK